MTKHSDNNSGSVAREVHRERPFSASTAKEPDNSLVTLLRQGMLFAQGQAHDDPHAHDAANRYEIFSFRTSAVSVLSDPISPRAQQQSLDELLEEVLQVISSTDGLVEGSSGEHRCHDNDRGAPRSDGSDSPNRGPLLPKQ
jgi:hypothetical protein